VRRCLAREDALEEALHPEPLPCLGQCEVEVEVLQLAFLSLEDLLCSLLGVGFMLILMSTGGILESEEDWRLRWLVCSLVREGGVGVLKARRAICGGRERGLRGCPGASVWIGESTIQILVEVLHFDFEILKTICQ